MSADAPPPFEDVPQTSAQDTSAPDTSAHPDQSQTAPTANGNSLKDAFVDSECTQFNPFPFASSDFSSDSAAAFNTVSNHPVTQNAKQTLTNGPVADSIKHETAKTSNELSGLANSRVQPDNTTANGQALTHYHSFFYSLLSWEQPRATAISFATSLILIFACRYLPILRWFFKVGYVAFGITALAEILGKVVVGTGVAASFRPRKYYRVPKETLETFLDDIEQLVNFFVIEFQRVLFAENPAATVAAFLSALASYYLVKLVPFWGLSLLSTCVIYLGPLVYIKNKETIDGQLEHATQVVSAQTAQIKDIAGQRTSQGFESVKQYTGDYAAKAQDLMGSARQKIPTTVGRGQPKSTVDESQFPSAPKTDPIQEQPDVTSTDRPIPAS